MAKKKASKRTTKAQKVAKVKRELKRFKLPEYNKVVKAKKILMRGSKIFMAMLEDGSVRMTEQTSIDGIAGGYNVRVLDVVEGLWRFRIITKSEYDAFVDWYKKVSSESSRQGDLIRAKELAGRYGYKLVKRHGE